MRQNILRKINNERGVFCVNDMRRKRKFLCCVAFLSLIFRKFAPIFIHQYRDIG